MVIGSLNDGEPFCTRDMARDRLHRVSHIDHTVIVRGASTSVVLSPEAPVS
jgi:hypothetical protein